MDGIAQTACAAPLRIAEELDARRVASDESTDADSGADEPSPSERCIHGMGYSLSPKVACPSSLCVSTVPSCWQLVWCHERCHKQDCDQKRAHIDEIANELGANLVCIKKAAKYALWLEQAQQSPYALLTDWREVKPSLQAAEQFPASSQPMFTVIFCELPKHFERASAWVQSLPARQDPVHICRNMGCLSALVAGLSRQLLGRVAKRALLGVRMGPPGQLSTPLRPFSPQASTQATAYGAFAWSGCEEADVEKEYEGIREQRDSMWLQPVQPVPSVSYMVTAQMPPWAVGLPPVNVVSVTGAEPWGQISQAHMSTYQMPALGPVPASPFSACESPQAIKEMLESAMPDHYDD